MAVQDNGLVVPGDGRPTLMVAGTVLIFTEVVLFDTPIPLSVIAMVTG